MPHSHATLSRLEPRSYKGNLKKAVDIAEHYGFRLVNPFAITREDREHAERHGCTPEHVALVRMASDEAIDQSDEAKSEVKLIAHIHKVPYKEKLEMRLDAIGDAESSAEGLLLQAATAILREYGHTNTVVALNSVGCKDTSTTFSQAVGAYVRSRLADLDPECKSAVRQSIFAPLRCSHGACELARAEAPQSLNFLTDKSKEHFKEVLEYLESLGLPYSINPHLVGNESYTTRTVFTIGKPAQQTDEETGVPSGSLAQILARGERYDQLAKKVGCKRTLPAVHVTLDLNVKPGNERYTPHRNATPPKTYVVQVGLPAKIRTLLIHESLRKNNVRVSLTLHKRGVAEQMEHAQNLNTSFLVIIGHKEVRDGAAVVRHLASNTQKTVRFDDLVDHLKTLANA